VFIYSFGQCICTEVATLCIAFNGDFNQCKGIIILVMIVYVWVYLYLKNVFGILKVYLRKNIKLI